MKKMKVFAVVLGLAVLPAQANDAACPTVRLDQTDPDVGSIPIWDQGYTPSCYVYASSFLATQWVRKKWAPRVTALSTHTDDPARVYADLQTAPDFEAVLDAENGRTCMSLSWNLKQKADYLRTHGHPALPMPRCEQYGLIREASRQVLRKSSEFDAKMKGLLKARQAFAIEYCSGVHRGGSEPLIVNRTFRKTLTYLNTPDAKDNFSSNCGFHVAVVVGQERVNGTCSYLVRNSWGTDASGSAYGYYWVPANRLSANTLRVVTLEAP